MSSSKGPTKSLPRTLALLAGVYGDADTRRPRGEPLNRQHGTHKTVKAEHGTNKTVTASEYGTHRRQLRPDSDLGFQAKVLEAVI